MEKYALILAGGMGKRMKSSLPKPCHLIQSLSMLQWVILAVENAGIENVCIVYGKRGEVLLKEAVINPEKYIWIEQYPTLGTGHAVRCAVQHYFHDKEGMVMVLNADAPFIQSSTIQKIMKTLEIKDAALLVAQKDNPFGYGRVIEDEEGMLMRIVEEKDATQIQKEIRRVNAGVYAFDLSVLKANIFRLNTDNAQGEYYITDIFEYLKQQDHKIGLVFSEKEQEILNINTSRQLEFARSILNI